MPCSALLSRTPPALPERSTEPLMNAPLDVKTIVNPFAPVPKKTLADVASELLASDLPVIRKRDLLWALRRISKLFGTPLSAIAADLDSLRILLTELQGK